MQVFIKRFDKTVPLPKQMTKGSAGFDVYLPEDLEIPAFSTKLVPLNIALKIPKNHFILLVARSSLYKKGVLLANGVGIGDSDFCGDQDEYKAILLNFTNKKVFIKKNTRILQFLVLKHEKVELTEVQKLEKESRGGYGSTGDK